MLLLVAFVLALTLAIHGWRKRSLSTSGGIAAFFVGFLMMSVKLHAFGISLIVLYYLGSKATHIGKKVKSALEEGHDVAGNRNAWQVLCNSFTALTVSMIWAALFTPHHFPGSLISLSSAPAYGPEAWCVISPSMTWSRRLVFAALGHFACCLGDTLASELGILSSSQPILITTLKPVPPGTNGGVSILGTACSIIGGILMGATYALTLSIENPACLNLSSPAYSLIAWGAIGGGLGSLIDSFLGATVQRTRFSKTKKLILQDYTADIPDAEIQVVAGFNILTNNQVNFLSSFLTAIIIASLA